MENWFGVAGWIEYKIACSQKALVMIKDRINCIYIFTTFSPVLLILGKKLVMMHIYLYIKKIEETTSAKKLETQGLALIKSIWFNLLDDE